MRTIPSVSKIALILLLSCTLSILAEALRDKRWAVPVSMEGVENLHCVDKGLYRSGQATAAGFNNLYEFGIRTVLSLRANHDDKCLADVTKLNLVRIPMVAWAIDEDEIIAALKIMRKREPGKPMLVHCWHGADRTGAVIAAYRMVCQNWTAKDAIQEMKEGGYGHHSLFRNIEKFLKRMDVEKIRQATAP